MGEQYGTFDIDSVYERLSDGSGQPFYGLIRTSAMIEAYGCNLDPDYQRGHVWTEEQQAKFIGHLIEGGRTTPPIINTGPKGARLYEEGKSEVLDGKQRITAALAFEANKIPAMLTDGREIYLRDMNKISQSQLRMTIGMAYQIVELDREQTLYWYIKLNRGGTVHTDAEINRVKVLLEKVRKS